MEDRKDREIVQRVFDTALSGIQEDPWMAQRILNAAETEGGQPVKKKISGMVMVWMVLLALSISTAIAAGVISWSRGLEDMLRVTDEVKESYQETELFDAPGISVTQGDVTITLEQSIVDPHAAYFAFRVKGFRVKEGDQPAFAEVSRSLDDRGYPFAMNSSFFNGLVSSGDGQAVYPDGSVPEDYGMLPYTDANGELVYTISIYSEETDLIGRTMQITLKDLGVYGNKWGDIEVQAPGTWSFEWVLKGNDQHLDLQDAALDVGDSGVQLTSLHLSPIHIRMQMNVVPSLAENMDDEMIGIPYFYGLRLRNGTRYELIAEGGKEGYISPDPDEHSYQMMYTLNRVVIPSEVESLLFVLPGDFDGEGKEVEVRIL